MERRGEYANDKERQVPRILHVLRDVCVRRSAMREPPFGVKVPPDVSERDQARVALQRVQPVPYPRIVGHVRFSSQPYPNAVTAVEQHGKKNRSPFHDQTERNRLQLLRDVVVSLRADQRGTVGPEMLGQKCANGKYAGKGMKLSEEITRVRLAGRERHALSAA